ncbi:NADH dehydrogenase [ubiquinone] 1 beta subcomplex subunit 10 [Lingula anatina]|uniref:NADH dehydrogenase [ubiquinone] 1 beta subcomplex subunit 10 n=1 Tax=Lingula anatina TaxID=7574 RepID=A0A1S3KC19_LINAN|nr:NADH dehydrogenase [ubiquinone] 1 beta subcomplex subunit 10 [Lingula anatina]|eukprot:XP_013420178.1 NADH dehydrogenase [ubiquinone] 1 beta subcomplex subunit 10 [Lingula anatina]
MSDDEKGKGPKRSGLLTRVDGFFDIMTRPAYWAKAKMDSMQENHKNVYYHRKYNRVPTIDQCRVGDEICMYEANQQFKRDFLVDKEKMTLLRRRVKQCAINNEFKEEVMLFESCKEIEDLYKNALLAYSIKYGELGAYPTAKSCYMKQKHRMIWERRHGKTITAPER